MSSFKEKKTRNELIIEKLEFYMLEKIQETIRVLIEEKRQNQESIAHIVSLTQPNVSRLYSRKYLCLSVRKLMVILLDLGVNFAIDTRFKNKKEMIQFYE